MIRSRAQYDAMTFDEVVADIKESLEDKTGLGIALTRSMARTLLAGLARPEAHPAITAIKEHNMGCLEACGKYTSHQHVRDARRCDSRRDCPDCPTDWVIDLNGLVPDEQPQPQRVQSSKENNDG
jgi:hypothetical protein